MQQIIAEELKLPLSQIAIRMSDSEVIPEDTGVGGSRVTHVYGLACQQAAREAREKLTSARPDEEVRVHVIFEGHRPDGCASVCAQMVEVAIDPDTGRVDVRKIWSAHDVGTVINPMYHQGQIDGGAIYGLGFAVTEELLIEDGKVLNPNLGEYKLPNIQDIPELVTVLVPGGGGPVPYAGKAIGEMSNVPVGAAVAAAAPEQRQRRRQGSLLPRVPFPPRRLASPRDRRGQRG
jgi:CO/xanthine dehydrogenase Mo-binding subunit